MPGKSQQKNRELKRVAQSCSKLKDLLEKSRPDDQSSTNENLNAVTGRNMQEELEAATQRCSWEKVFWEYAANLQENTHAEVQFQ